MNGTTRVAVEQLRDLFEREPDAVRDFGGRFFGERHQHDPVRIEVVALEHQLHDLGDDRRRLACSRSRLDHEIAALRLRGQRGGDEVERLLDGHSPPPRSVRGSPCCWTA